MSKLYKQKVISKQSETARVLASKLEALGCKAVGYRAFGLSDKTDGYMYLTNNLRQYKNALVILNKGCKRITDNVGVTRDNIDIVVSLVVNMPSDEELLEPLLHNRKDKWFNKNCRYTGMFKELYEKVHKEID